jgi:hypothetical protein
VALQSIAKEVLASSMWNGVALTSGLERQVMFTVDNAGVADFAGEQRKLTDDDDAPVVLGSAAGDIAHLVGKTKAGAIDQSFRVRVYLLIDFPAERISDFPS